MPRAISVRTASGADANEPSTSSVPKPPTLHAAGASQPEGLGGAEVEGQEPLLVNASTRQ
jgi:hypothetical protein